MKKLLLFCAAAIISLSASAYTVTYNLTGCTGKSTNPTSVTAEDEELDLFFDLADGYTWTGAEISVTMGGTPLVDLYQDPDNEYGGYGFSEETGNLYVSLYEDPFSGDFVITLTAAELPSGGATWGETLENGVLSIAPANKSVTYLPCVMDADWYNSFMEEYTEEQIYDGMILMMYTSDMLLSGDKSGADLADYTSYANLTAAGDHYLFIAECTADPEDNEYIVRTGALSVIKLTVAGIKLPATFTAANFEDIEIGANGVYRPNTFEGGLYTYLDNEWLSGAVKFSTTAANYGYMSYSGIQAVNLTEMPAGNDKYLLSANNAAAEGSNYGVLNITYGRLFESVKLTPTVLSGMAINNVAYAVGSVTVGDDYARPLFTAGDYFTLTIKALRNGIVQGTVDVDLAKFDETTGELSVVEDWMWVDFVDALDMTIVDELQFSIDGSDAGAWGLNTPAYFCMDNIGGMKSACSLGAKTAYRELPLNLGYATMCWDKDWTVEGADVYTGKWNAEENCIDLYQVADGKVPAGEAVIVNATAEKVLLKQLHESVATLKNNDLKGNATNAADNFAVNGTRYVLASDGAAVNFYKVVAGATEVAAHRAYLDVPAAAGASVRMRIVNAATGVNNTNATINANKRIENGMLIIERDGKKFNVMGVQF